jgi:hypothetical protein
MDWSQARDELLVRHYAWSLRQWQAEEAREFAGLRDLRTQAADQFLAALQRLPAEKVGLATVAVTKRAHSRAVALLKQELNALENAVLAELDTYRHMWTNANPAEKGLALAERRRAAPRIKQLLEGLGTPEGIGSLEWRYTAQVGGWTLQTYVDVGGQYGDLSYGHSLSVSAECAMPGRISRLASLGISNSKWRLKNESDVEYAAWQVARLSREFVETVPALVDGLAVES